MLVGLIFWGFRRTGREGLGDPFAGRKVARAAIRCACWRILGLLMRGLVRATRKGLGEPFMRRELARAGMIRRVGALGRGGASIVVFKCHGWIAEAVSKSLFSIGPPNRLGRRCCFL